MTQAPGPAPSPMQAFQERFAALQRDWRAQLPQRLREAQDGLRACADSPDDADGLDTLHRLLHTLAGSAGTFGLAEAGEQAKAVENELDRLRALPARRTKDFDEAGRRLDALARMVEAA